MNASRKILISILASIAITGLAGLIDNEGWIYLLVIISHYGLLAGSVLFLLLANAGKIKFQAFGYYFTLVFNIWLACLATIIYICGKVNASLPLMYIENAIAGLAMLAALFWGDRLTTKKENRDCV